MDPNVHSTVTWAPSAFVSQTSVSSLRTCDPCLRVEPILADVDMSIGLAERGRGHSFDGRFLNGAFHKPMLTRAGAVNPRDFRGPAGRGWGRVVADQWG